MRFSRICEGLDCRVFRKGENFDQGEVRNVAAGDLMSEVLVFDMDDLLLVTSLNSEQALRTAGMVDALAVLLVNGKEPNPKMVALAEELGLTLLSTPLTMFDACSRLHGILDGGD